MKEARVYAELAEFARGRGYPVRTASAVHSWGKGGMLLSARNLGRQRRRAGRLPAAMRERVLAICRYHYDLAIRDLGVVTLLLWLDGEQIEPDPVRAALRSIHRHPKRFVALVGHPALRAEGGAVGADLEAAADALRGAIAAEPWSEPVEASDLANSAVDFLRLATGQGTPEATSDLEPIAVALGLERARSEGLAEADPWLQAGDPATSLQEALMGVFGATAGGRIESATDEELHQARDTAIRLAPIFAVFLDILRLGFAPGAGGFGMLAPAAKRAEARAWLAYVALQRPTEAAELANQFSSGRVDEWAAWVAVAETWLTEHPALVPPARERGLLAVLREQASDVQ